MIFDKQFDFLKGIWDLSEATFADADGAVQMPWGPSPIGIAFFADAGCFSVHIMRAQRARFTSEYPTPAEKVQAYDDYFSFFGQIVSFDQNEGRMTNQIGGATNSNWTGGQQIRYLEVEDEDHIVFRTPPIPIFGGALVGRLRWQRRRPEGA
jgi:hypothetical protein